MPADPIMFLAAGAVPTGPTYSALLLAHVASAVIGFGALAVSGLQANAAARGPGGDRDEAVRRYFRPGVNGVARALYGVPVFGFALVAASHGAFTSGDGFVVAGLVLWLAAVGVAEAALWPAERRLQEMVTGDWAKALADGSLVRDCRRVVTASAVLAAVFVAAVVLMVAQP